MRGYYFLGYTLCALEAAMGAVAGLMTSWSLAVLSFERYLVICKPFGAFKYIPEGLGCACGPDWYTHSEEYKSTSYMHFLLVTCFIAPLTIIIFTYSQTGEGEHRQ
ncbi:hypothetical protein L3Q82_000423 [Scortum barcoo]|uniref:Uncharacterized protein n=1 Tax=Scortum barcoo TaxID=214431 RepID=A0ACB8WET9_9TELE|nr:hypothetical protein L3Q82_000423 [Scortum barcoo]